VRSLIGIITTIATVIHFTFGCCLHPCHSGGRGERFTHTIEAAACEACCHDHQDATEELDGERCGFGNVSFLATLVSDTCHGCEGCRCAATSTETVTTLPWSPLACGIAAARDSDAITMFAITCGKHPPDPHIHPCPSHCGLFERFLI